MLKKSLKKGNSHQLFFINLKVHKIFESKQYLSEMGKESSNKAIVILGNGVSGITAARHLRKNSALPITVISEESPYFFHVQH